MKIQSIVLFLFISIFGSLVATNRHVPNDYSTIQAALNACSNGDSVFVAPGIYLENIIWPQVDGIVLKSTGDMLNTIIDANHIGRGISFVWTSPNPAITSATKINGFTIRYGYSNLNGAGVNCFFASPEFNNCIIANNECTSSGSGGGIYCYSASPVFNNVIIVRNRAYSGGGAHIDPLSSPIFNNCVVADNSLFSPGGSFAAGIYGRYNVYFQLNNCTITRNIFSNTSAIHIGEQCVPIIRHSTITDNLSGIMVMLNGGLDIQYSNITNNLFDGVWHNDNDSDILNAQNNWWGSDTGPYHDTTNPQGQGNNAIGNVNFSNWLQNPDPQSPITPPVSIGIFDITNNSFLINWASNPETDINHYVINYGTDSLSVIHPNNISTSNYSYTLTNLTPNTNYAIQLAAVSNRDVQSWYSAQYVVHTTGGTSIADVVIPEPVLNKSYPNPFTGSTRISYELKQPGQATMAIYNIKGELVKQVFSGLQVSGASEVIWNGRNDKGESASSGIYFVKLVQNGRVNTQKLILMK